jgi:hypothetical protein
MFIAVGSMQMLCVFVAFAFVIRAGNIDERVGVTVRWRRYSAIISDF